MALDYAATAQPRLTSEFYNSPRLVGLVGESVAPMTEAEDSADDLMTDRWIETAIGAQLDGCGYLVHVQRNGMDDDDYRIAIQQKTILLTSQATPPDLINSLRYMTRSWVGQYYELRPATCVLYTDGVGKFVPSTIQAAIQSIAPAAINDVPVCVGYASWSLRFTYSAALTVYGQGALAVHPEKSNLTAIDADIRVTADGQDSGLLFAEKGLGGIAPADLWVLDGYLEIGGGEVGVTLVASNPEVDLAYGGNYMCGVFQ